MVSQRAEGPPAPRVLHVVHRLGSGVESALTSYATVAEGFEHHLLFSPDSSCRFVALGSGCFATSVEAPDGLVAFRRAVRERIAQLRPAIVHAHSSIAGLVVRGMSRNEQPVVYTPHCFAFLRRDVALPTRAAFWSAEAALAPRTTAFAACSPHEALQARRLPASRERVCYVPNVAAVRLPVSLADRKSDVVRRVIASGRICPQKDPGTFAAIAQAVRQRVSCEFVWIGAGDQQLVAILEAAGVRVTGWLSADDAQSEMTCSDLYVHTALWEAAPVTVLEAAALGVPIFARDSAPMRSLGLAPLWGDVNEVVQQIVHGLDDRVWEELQSANARLRATHTKNRQRAALVSTYEAVLAATHAEGADERALTHVGPTSPAAQRSSA